MIDGKRCEYQIILDKNITTKMPILSTHGLNEGLRVGYSVGFGEKEEMIAFLEAISAKDKRTTSKEHLPILWGSFF